MLIESTSEVENRAENEISFSTERRDIRNREIARVKKRFKSKAGTNSNANINNLFEAVNERGPQFFVGGRQLGKLKHAVAWAERALVLHHSSAGARHPKRAELRQVAPRRGLLFGGEKVQRGRKGGSKREKQGVKERGEEGRKKGGGKSGGRPYTSATRQPLEKKRRNRIQ